MKVKPVMDALEERGAKVILVHTGQHYDPAMSDVFFEGTNRLVGREPDRIVRAAREVMAAPPPPPRRPALWDGQAGQRIAAVLAAGFP